MSSPFVGRIALASVTFDLAGVPSMRVQSGDFDSAVTDTNVGDVTLTLVQEIDPNDACYTVSPRSPGYAFIGATTDSTIQVTTLDPTGFAADLDFDLVIHVLPKA